MLSAFACTNGQVTASDGRILGLTAFARKDSIVNFHLVRPIFIFGILKQWLGRWFVLSKGLKPLELYQESLSKWAESWDPCELECLVAFFFWWLENQFSFLIIFLSHVCVRVGQDDKERLQEMIRDIPFMPLGPRDFQRTKRNQLVFELQGICCSGIVRNLSFKDPRFYFY